MPERTPYSSSTTRMRAGLMHRRFVSVARRLWPPRNSSAMPSNCLPVAGLSTKRSSRDHDKQALALLVEALPGLSGDAAQHDDGHLARRSSLADLVGQPEAAVVALHHEVEEDDVGGGRLQEVQRLLAVLRGVHHVAPAAEEGGLGVEEVPVVVDEEDVPAGSSRAPFAACAGHGDLHVEGGADIRARSRTRCCRCAS